MHMESLFYFLAIVQIAVFVLAQPIATLAVSYGSHFSLQGPPLRDVGVLLGTGVVLGWIGAWISAAPSKMLRMRASHSRREAGNSSANPLPP